MRHAETLITGIEYKVRKLTEKNHSLKAKNEKLAGELRSMQAQIENLFVQQRKLENKINVITLAKSLNKEDSRTNVKLKINELVRDIDRCIGLLNK